MIDLDLRSNKFDKEQQKRRDEAKRKKAKEMESQKEQARREQELAVRAAQRREELEQAEMAKQLAEDEERSLTGGIRFAHSLKPYLIDGEDDKVILPEVCLTELTQQDAFGRGALTFQLSHFLASNTPPDSKVTHCGVREFSAPEGAIGIPPKVVASLTAQDVASLGALHIKFVLLPKCTFAKLQPKHNNFIEVGPVKQCLEENLRFHTTLSVGDQLTVWYRGKAHELLVTEMKPADKGTLVDTDVEIDLELSEEYLRHEREQQALQPPAQTLGGRASTPTVVPATRTNHASNSATSSTGNGSAVPSNVFRSAAGQSTPPNEPTTAVNLDTSSTHALYAQLLSPEPSSSDKDIIALKIKLPNGGTKTRRFAHAAAVAQLFLYLACELLLSPGTSGDVIEKLQISTRFPARTLRLSDVHSGPVVSYDGHSSSNDKTFKDLGLNIPSEAVFVTVG